VPCDRLLALSFATTGGGSLLDDAAFKMKAVPCAAVPLRQAPAAAGERPTITSHPSGEAASPSQKCSVLTSSVRGTFRHDRDAEGGSGGATPLVPSGDGGAAVVIHDGNANLVGGSAAGDAGTALTTIPSAALAGALVR
jgi:hypothetical protein